MNIRINGVLAFAGAIFPGLAMTANLSVTVLDRDSTPVPNVAVWVEAAAIPPRDPGTAVLDQQNVRFVPHILVVQAGTSVEFPNNDEVAHHVYSFSKPNEFKLPIYKGEAHPPVIFDHPGVATLGCNIHDHMLAFILVVETPVFTKTDANGIASLDGVPDGTASVRIWSPRIKDANDSLSQEIEPHGSGEMAVGFTLQKKLRRPHDHDSDALAWSEYD